MLGQSLYWLYSWNRKQKPNHRYAMQPLVLKSMQTFRDYFSGLKPDYALKEDLMETYWTFIEYCNWKNYKNRQNAQAKSNKDYFTDAKSINGVQNQMYIDKKVFESVESIIKCR
jgi:hypothetical protein